MEISASTFLYHPYILTYICMTIFILNKSINPFGIKKNVLPNFTNMTKTRAQYGFHAVKILSSMFSLDRSWLKQEQFNMRPGFHAKLWLKKK